MVETFYSGNLETHELQDISNLPIEFEDFVIIMWFRIKSCLIKEVRHPEFIKMIWYLYLLTQN